MTAPGSGFLDMDQVSLADANVAVLCFPFEGTVSYGGGTARGPSAILTASRELETFDEELEVDLVDVLKVAVVPPLSPQEGEPPKAYLARVTELCAGLGLAPPFPLSLGGEHSLTPAILRGLRDDFSDVTVVQIDAHADLRDEYLGKKESHASAMARVLDLGVKRLISIGIRSTEAEEFARARDDERIDTWYAHELRDSERWNSLLAALRGITGPTYLTIDVDGLDGCLVPATGTPQPGGVGWYQAMDVLKALLLEGQADVFGADLMETVPMEGSKLNELTAAKLGLKVLGLVHR